MPDTDDLAQASGAPAPFERYVSGSLLMRILGLATHLLPGEYLKTLFYLNVIEKPRRALRSALLRFYRIDVVYAVLRDSCKYYDDRFSILEFGTSDGYTFDKILYATKYLGVSGRVVVHTFDTFEGMPAPVDGRDETQITDDTWVAGEYRGRYEELEAHCAPRYTNYRIHKGTFERTITPEFLEGLRTHLPILIWVDCDYYSSARTVLERILPYLPNGCVLYFDDLDSTNYGSRLTGEARLVHEINRGDFGADVELVFDQRLALDSKRVYRFFRYDSTVRYRARLRSSRVGVVRRRTNGSPLP